jgi:hypothetical protein
MLGRPCVDILGKRFGRIVVIEKTAKRSQESIVWKCRCDCGKETFVSTGNLRSGNTVSCGCFRREKTKLSFQKHGCTANDRVTKEYRTWDAMKERCYNPKCKQFKNYGGRGIKVCDEWLHSFENFLAYLKANKMYPKPVGMSIDRIDNDGNYEPGNIRWATQSQQNCNQRSRSKKEL